MCSFSLTQSQDAHKAVVEIIGDQIRYFNEWHLIHICRTLSLYAVIRGIEYEVERYITTGLLPFEHYSEERPWTDEEKWWALTSGAR